MSDYIPNPKCIRCGEPVSYAFNFSQHNCSVGASYQQPSSAAQPEVKRLQYEVTFSDESDNGGSTQEPFVYMVEHKDGDYVLYSEHEQKVASLAGELERVHGYLVRLLKQVAPEVQPLDSAAHVATQIDNYICGLRAELERVKQEREEAEKDVRRAMYAIAGWFGIADAENGKTPDELGRFLYERERESAAALTKHVLGIWKPRAESAESQLSAAREALRIHGHHLTNCEYFAAVKPHTCTCGYEKALADLQEGGEQWSLMIG